MSELHEQSFYYFDFDVSCIVSVGVFKFVEVAIEPSEEDFGSDGFLNLVSDHMFSLHEVIGERHQVVEGVHLLSPD